MQVASLIRYRIATVLVCLAVGVAVLIGDDESVDHVARRQPTSPTADARDRVPIHARRSTMWPESSRRSGRPDPVSLRSTTGDLPRAAESRGINASTAPLNASLVERNSKVRLDAVIALTMIGGDEAVAALTPVALSDPDVIVRHEAVYALGEIGSEASMETLEHALSDPDLIVREAAVEALAGMGGESSALALAVALQDADASLRTEAVDALGRIGGQTAIQLLRQAAMDPQTSVREEAQDLLVELSGMAKEENCSQAGCPTGNATSSRPERPLAQLVTDELAGSHDDGQLPALRQ